MTAPPTNQKWKECESTIMDAWGNPIILVPACGMTVRISGVQKHLTSAGFIPAPVVWTMGQSYNVPDMVMYQIGGVYQLFRCIQSSPSETVPTHSTYWVRINTQPFFASAGPDGLFGGPVTDGDGKVITYLSGGDDNVYSFEN
jgi:hypothetical protein